MKIGQEGGALGQEGGDLGQQGAPPCYSSLRETLDVIQRLCIAYRYMLSCR